MKKTIGAFEKVSFPNFGLFDVVAKIDTGAYSGTIHASNIREVVIKSTGAKALRFHPFGLPKSVKSTAYHRKKVKSSNGDVSVRYVIQTTIELEGVQYPIHITLADRSSMKKKVLIGRRFLRKHGFLVDTTKGTQYRFHTT